MLKRMGNGIEIAMGLLLVALVGAGCQQQQTVPPAAPVMDQAARIKRGQYLVTVGSCNDCHTPFKMGEKGPEPDMSRMLSGHPENLKLPAPPKFTQEWPGVSSATNTAWAGPWGISYTANLTPDEITGLGIWDEAMFFKALRNGRHMGDGRPILPPMPWLSLAAMTDEDLKSVFAYLKSIPPIVNHVPDAIEAAPPK